MVETRSETTVRPRSTIRRQLPQVIGPAATLLVLATAISVQALVLLASMLLAAWFVVSLPRRLRLKPYAWGLPLAVFILVSIVSVQIGIAPVIGLAAVAVAAAAGLVIAYRRGHGSPLSTALTMPAFGAFAVPLGSMAVIEHLGHTGASFSWLMTGDGLSELRLMGLYRTLDTFQYVPTHFPFATSGHLLLADAISFGTGVGGGRDQMLADIRALTAVVVLSAIVAVAQLQSRFGTSRDGWRGLAQGLTLGVLASSGAVLGLAASNGFVSTAVTFALFALVLSAAATLSRRWTPSSLVVVGMGALALMSTWQPIGLTAGALGIAAMWSSRRGTPLAFSSAVAVTGAFAFWWALSGIGVPSFPEINDNAYYFPITPIAVFLLSAAALAIIPTRGTARIGSRAAAAAFVAGSIVFTAIVARTDFLGVLADSHILSSTRYYYVLKFIWLISMPLIPLLLVVLLRSDVRTRIGTRTATFASVLVLAAAITAANTPNFAWLPFANQERNRTLAELATASDDNVQVFIDPLTDGTFNGWSRWRLDFYGPDHTSDILEWKTAGITTFGQTTPWEDAFSYLDTASITDDELCEALALVPEPASITTASEDTARRISENCSDLMADGLRIDLRSS